jgi:hypothetical protein
VQNSAQQRAVDFYAAIVINEAQFPKLNHLRGRLLARFRQAM